MIDFIKTSGIFGFASLGTGILLVIIALIMICVVRKRKPFIVLAFVCATSYTGCFWNCIGLPVSAKPFNIG